jgi:hypothetical protein
VKAMLLKTDKGLRGATPADHEAWSKFRRRLETMKPGTWLRMEWARPRHGKHHRKLFALLNLVAENSETYDTTEKALVAVKLVTGYADPVIDPRTGELTQVPQSISYDAMDQDEFDKFYQAAIDGVLRYILTDMDRATADRLLEMIILGWG